MSTTGIKTHSGVRRCAVCKIDRKGRFILADPQAQDIFGLGEVELFGRPLIDFVDPADHELIEVVTSNRNPYETVYDAVRVALLDHEQNRIDATLIFSVNFGGGNPANYQIIINTDLPERVEIDQEQTHPWHDYLAFLAESEQVESPGALAQHLINLKAVDGVAIYESEVHEENLLARLGCGPVDAESDAEVDSTSEEDIHATFGLADGRRGVAVLAPARSSTDGLDIRVQVELAAVTLHTLCPAVALDEPTSESTPSSLKLLNQLDIGVLEIDRRGQVTRRNDVFDEMIGDSNEVGCLEDLIALMEERGDVAEANAITAYFRSTTDLAAPPRLNLNLGLAGVGTVALSFERANPVADDFSGCFLFSQIDSRLTAGSEGLQAPIDLTLVGLDRLRSSTAAARSVLLKMEHLQPLETSDNALYHLRSLSYHLDNVEQTLIDLAQVLDCIGAPEETQIVNLGLTIDKIRTDLETAHPGIAIEARHSDLPVVRGPLKKLTTALRHCLSAAVARADAEKLEVRVSAKVKDGTCTIVIEDDAPRLTRKQARKAFEYIGPACSHQDRSKGNRPAGLAQARALICSMGGRVVIDPECATGSGIRIVFPEA